MSDPALIFVLGPTASGKSSLAENLAQDLSAELVSMDSAQIYRGMDIGTAKPDAAVRAAIPHHLLDICDPVEAYSAAQFAQDARRCVLDIHARGKRAIIVGGTFLYMRALLEGLHEMPGADPKLRKRLEQQAALEGWPALHAQLQALDPEAAAKIHPNDAQRIQRALEIVQLSGQSRSQAWQGASTPGWQGPVLKLAIVPSDRERLRANIALRFEQMMQQGFLQEVARLRERGDLNLQLPSMRSVGYRQLWQHLDGELGLDEAVSKAVIATRQYAKRQMTWLRREKNLAVLPQDAGQRVEEAERLVQKFLSDRGA